MNIELTKRKSAMLTALYGVIIFSTLSICSASFADSPANNSIHLKQGQKSGQLNLQANKPRGSKHTPMGGSSKFSNGQRGGSEATVDCYSIQECNQMISDCISVGGTFEPGTHDPYTGAVNNGRCRL
jgi:hypothetical protein